MAGDLAGPESLRHSAPDFYFSQNTTRQGVDYWACWLRALSSTFRTRHHDEVPCFVERSGRHPAPGGRLRDWARTETATAVREIYAAEGTAYGQAVTWEKDFIKLEDLAKSS